MQTTIAVITYNYASYLAEAIASALAQDDRAGVKVLVVDDGSTDETPQVAARFGDAITYHRKPNGGLSDARNTAAELCDTKYLVYLDADNALPPDYVRQCRLALERDPGASFAYTQLHYFGERSGATAFPPYDPNRLKRGSCIDACSLMLTSVARGHPYDVRLRAGLEDWDFYLSLAEDGLYGVLVEGSFVHYRVHATNMGKRLQQRRWQRRRTMLRIRRRHWRFIGAREAFRMLGRSLRHHVGAAADAT